MGWTGWAVVVGLVGVSSWTGGGLWQGPLGLFCDPGRWRPG